MQNLKIGLAYDLRSDYLKQGYSEECTAEFDSEDTIQSLEKTLISLGHEVELIGNGRALAERLSTGSRWDLVFNICEGLDGRSREAQVPAILELFNQPYTFSDPLTCALTLDKSMAKRLVLSHGLNTPRFKLVRRIEELEDLKLRYPLFAKPNDGGTGQGISSRSRATDKDQLRSICSELLKHSSVLVEEYLPGREFTVGIVGNGDSAEILGIMQIVIPSGNVYTYEMKEQCEKYVKYLGMEKDELYEAISILALSSYSICECRDAGRVDIRLDSCGCPSFMEINPLPGLNPTHSDLPMIATMAGMSYPELISRIIKEAVGRLPTT